MDEAVGLTQGGSSLALRMELSFDGSGNFTYMEVAHSSGTPKSGSGTYSVSSDGSLTFSTGGEGIVSADGNTLTWTDTDATDNIVSISVGTKKTSTQSQTFAITNFSEGDTLPSTTPVFTWSAKSGADEYLVRIMIDNINGNCGNTSSCLSVWTINPVTTTSVVYNSDGNASQALLPGSLYRANILAYSSGSEIDRTGDVKFRVSN